MNLQFKTFKKEFKAYDKTKFEKGAEFVEIHYSSGWANQKARITVKPMVIKEVTNKTTTLTVTYPDTSILATYPNGTFRKTVGMLHERYLIVPKCDKNEAIAFMLDAYKAYYAEQLALLQRKITELHNVAIEL